MQEKIERFKIETTRGGADVYFDTSNKKVFVIVPLGIVLIVVGLFLFLNGSMDMFGFVGLLVVSTLIIILGFKKPPSSMLCQINNSSLTFPRVDHDNFVLPITEIKNVLVQTKPDVSLNIFLVASFQYKIMFEVDNRDDMFSGFSFSFEKNAIEFSKQLKELLKLS